MSTDDRPGEPMKRGETGDQQMPSKGEVGDQQMLSKGEAGDQELPSIGEAGDQQMPSKRETGGKQMRIKGEAGNQQRHSNCEAGDQYIPSKPEAADQQRHSKGEAGDQQKSSKGEERNEQRSSKEPIMVDGSSVFFRKDKRKDFDLEFVYDALVRCNGDDGVLDLGEYLSAYHELCRFFKLTGRLFGFVASDLEGKIKTLESRISGPNGKNYQTIQGMLQYEVDNGIARVRGRAASGSRTLLRLHWALEFILEFMHRISISGDEDRTSVIAPEVYAATLSKHHPWFTRKMAAVAMYFLPSRKDLIEVMCKQSYSEVLDMLDKVVHAGTVVYKATDETYATYDLLHIK